MSTEETLSALALPEMTVSATLSTDLVFRLFDEEHSLRALVVVDQGLPVGLVERSELIELFAQPYGRSLYGRRPIAMLMNSKPLMLDEHTGITAASREVTAGGDPELMQSFIITRHGRYLGLGRVRDLLARLTDMQLRDARHANPLTGLPGNVPLNQHINEQLACRVPMAVAYVDCNDFKPYNDVYGYAAGDRVLRELGLLLEQHAAIELDFVGHVGGDDFVLVFTSPDWEARCHAILRDFAALAHTYYTQNDCHQGGIFAEDRQGQPCFFPLLSIAIGVCLPDPGLCPSHLEVAALATDAKHEAKQGLGNFLFVSQRRGPAGHHGRTEKPAEHGNTTFSGPAKAASAQEIP
jgi:diguanylate cyclase (GGDEF)-like protein